MHTHRVAVTGYSEIHARFANPLTDANNRSPSNWDFDFVTSTTTWIISFVLIAAYNRRNSQIPNEARERKKERETRRERMINAAAAANDRNKSLRIYIIIFPIYVTYNTYILTTVPYNYTLN